GRLGIPVVLEPPAGVVVDVAGAHRLLVVRHAVKSVTSPRSAGRRQSSANGGDQLRTGRRRSPRHRTSAGTAAAWLPSGDGAHPPRATTGSCAARTRRLPRRPLPPGADLARAPARRSD